MRVREHSYSTSTRGVTLPECHVVSAEEVV